LLAAVTSRFAPPPTPGERSWLDSFISISSIHVPPPVTLSSTVESGAHQSVLTFVREPGPELAHIFGRLGRSADECLTHYANPATKTLNICAADGPDDLNEFTREVAAAFKKPFVLSDYCADI
jgi:hypothetical protein